MMAPAAKPPSRPAATPAPSPERAGCTPDKVASTRAAPAARDFEAIFTACPLVARRGRNRGRCLKGCGKYVYRKLPAEKSAPMDFVGAAAHAAALPPPPAGEGGRGKPHTHAQAAPPPGELRSRPSPAGGGGTLEPLRYLLLATRHSLFPRPPGLSRLNTPLSPS